MTSSSAFSDPKLLANLIRSEIELCEEEARKSQESEKKLIELVHSMYLKIEELQSELPDGKQNDRELRRINRALREVLAERQLAEPADLLGAATKAIKSKKIK